MGRGLHFTPALSRHGSLLLSLLSSELTTNLQTPLESGNQVRACLSMMTLLVIFSWFSLVEMKSYSDDFKNINVMTHDYQKFWF